MYNKILVTLDATPTDRAIIEHVKELARVMHPAAIIGENTWHYAKHWKALEELGDRDFFGAKTPSYAPSTMAKSDMILSRAVMFGLNIVMDDASIHKIITAIKAGAEASL